MSRKREHRKTIESVAEERAIYLLEKHDTKIDANDAKIICTQLETRSNNRAARGGNVANMIVGVGRTVAGMTLGIGALNYEKTGSLTANVTKGIINHMTKL